MLIPRENGMRSSQLAFAGEILSRKHRKLILRGPIIDTRDDIYSPAQVSSVIEYLSLEDPPMPIRLEISSPGGEVPTGLALIDRMDASPCEIWTIGSGSVFSMAAVILACGTKNRRFIYPNCKTMIHMPRAPFEGSKSERDIYNKQMEQTEGILAELLASRCGQEKSRILNDMERDFFMTAEEAKAYGLVDHIIAAGSLRSVFGLE